MLAHGLPLASVFVAAAFAGALAAGSARAACDAIPERPQAFRGALGTVSTPLGRPDSPSPQPDRDPRDVEVASSRCNPTRLESQDYVVTLVFKPPRGAASIVALTAQEDCAALKCDDGQSFHCVAGAKAGILASTASNKLRFRFPDTAGLVKGYGRGLTGPALVAVSRSSDPLPCKLAGQRCRDADRPQGLFACVDEIFEDEASCNTARADLDPTFPHFTVLPAMNDWQKLCKAKKPPCLDLGGDLLLTVDSVGDALLPVSWAGVLAPMGAKRGVEGGTRIPAEGGGQAPIRVPSDRFLTSLPPQGMPDWPSPPTFKRHPIVRPDWFDLTGDTDKPESVLKISRRKLWEHECQGIPHAAEACEPGVLGQCGLGVCVQRSSPSYFACAGGNKAGLPCSHPADCGAGKCLAGSTCVATSTGVPGATPCQTDLDCAANEECGRGLFELRDRLVGGVGPIVIPPADYEAKVK